MAPLVETSDCDEAVHEIRVNEENEGEKSNITKNIQILFSQERTNSCGRALSRACCGDERFL